MISQRIIHLQPDLIIVFCGINDITAAVYEADYIHMPQATGKVISFIDLAKYILTEFQLPRRLYYAYKGIFKAPGGDDLLTSISFKSDYKSKVALRKSAPQSDEPPRIDIESYRNNLQSLIGLARIHDIRLIFMTQATTWNSRMDPATEEWHWGTYKNGLTYRTDLMDAALSQYNETMRLTAARDNIPVFDLALLMPKTLEFFYDDCHFNIEGAQQAGHLLGNFLIENNVVK
jgi:lysophospholipase L1-like esterase